MKRKTKWLVGVCALLILAMVTVYFLPIHGEEAVYESVLRLHVLANSDSEEDQTVKLCVRDAVLEAVTPLLEPCTSRDEAEACLRENLARIEQTAAETLAALGRSDAVSVSIGQEEYPTRNYETCCFPAGEYLSLIVKIGEGEGHNWWCVLFPPLCLSAAKTKTKKQTEDAFIAVGLTADQYRVITETDEAQYKARFKILEAFQKIKK